MNKTAKNLSLSIGISAFNEEQNIENLLSSILSQRNSGYTIVEIFVISDGSTDQTVEKVRSFRSKKIHLISDSVRLGKAQRLNYIFKNAKSDAILILDADIVLSSPDVIRLLIEQFQSAKKIGFVSGNAKPRKGETFIEKSVVVSQEAYDRFRTHIRAGNNPYCAEGRIMLLSKKFIENVTLPGKMFAIDNYLYFVCLKKGFSFKFAKSAVVYYRCPSTLKDQIIQNTRFVARRYKLESIFGDIVTSEYKVSMLLKYASFFKSFLSEPVYSLSICCINIYCKLRARTGWKNITSKWDTTPSTKISNLL